MTPTYRIDPLADPRWAEFVERHPRASIFHTPGWLQALRRTYGYLPVAYTTTPPGPELTNGLVLCRVQSLLSGRSGASDPGRLPSWRMQMAKKVFSRIPDRVLVVTGKMLYKHIG